MGGFLPLGCVYIYYTMQYEISGSVLAGQITTTTWAGAPSRTWAWSRAIGGAGRGIGGAGQFASWTRAAQLRTSTWAEAAVARATVPPQAFNSAGGPAQGAPWAKAAVDRAWARRGPGRLSSRRRPGRWLRRGPGPGLGRSVGLAAASVGLASSRRGPGRLSSRRSPGRRQRWPGPRYPPRRSTLRRTWPGRALGEGSGRSGLGAPWTRAAQLATSAWAVAPSRTWA